MVVQETNLIRKIYGKKIVGNIDVQYAYHALTEYSHSQASLINLWVTKCPSFQIKLNDNTTFNITSSILKRDDIDLFFNVKVESVSGFYFTLCVTKGLWHILSSPWVASTFDFEKLPVILKDAFLEAVFEPLLEGIGHAFKMVLTLTYPTQIQYEIKNNSLVGLRVAPVDLDKNWAGALLQFDVSASSTLVSILKKYPSISYYQYNDIALPVILFLGEIWINKVDVRNLGLCDILFISSHFKNELHVILKLDKKSFALASIEREKLSIIHLMEETLTKSDSSLGTGEIRPLNTEELEVPLHFDLGNINVKLSDLQSLRPGFSFTLDMPVTGNVRILSGSQLIGKGELVQIGDRLGVQITQLFQD